MTTQTLLDYLAHLDAPRKMQSSPSAPKPCGKGWEGTKPPGCKRKQKGSAAGSKKFSKRNPEQDLNDLKTAIAERSKEKSKTKPKGKAEKTIEELRKSYNPADRFESSPLSDIGNLMNLYSDEIDLSGGKVVPALKKALEKGDRNWKPAISTLEYKKKQLGGARIEEMSAVGKYSSDLIASARAAGDKRVFTILMPNDPKQIEVARALDVPDATTLKAGSVKGNPLTDIGNYKSLYEDEIKPYKGKGHNASDTEVEAAARLMLKNNSRNWVPVLVKETGEDQYEVVGNHFAYDVAKKAGIDRMWAVVVPPDSVVIPKTSRKTKKDSFTLLDYLKSL